MAVEISMWDMDDGGWPTRNISVRQPKSGHAPNEVEYQARPEETPVKNHELTEFMRNRLEEIWNYSQAQTVVNPNYKPTFFNSALDSAIDRGFISIKEAIASGYKEAPIKQRRLTRSTGVSRPQRDRSNRRLAAIR